ncbi:2,3-bisphosphoglycerate-independent phosphoglycerate mutase [Bacteroidia bacterium]|nr:2,3-bisphosphoglycerate-independent phosphoglycerate mutase [Bacteroidia bacterium]
MSSKPLVLCILDGVGISDSDKNNAVKIAEMPFFNGLLRDFPNTQLEASGPAVGLPVGTMGNSEVGHIAIGAGRIVNQFLRRFQIAETEGLEKNSQLQTFISKVKGTVHILGLCSDGRVHSDIEEAITTARIILNKGRTVCWHFIADGRDTPPQSALKYASRISNAFVKEIESEQLRFGSLSGRYYAMDRNANWYRTELAFNAIVHGQAEFSANDIITAIKDAYDRGETDEFIKPTIILPPTGVFCPPPAAKLPTPPQGGSLAPILNSPPAGESQSATRDAVGGDNGILFFNYRADRARQILKALTFQDFAHFARGDYVAPVMLCFSQYGEGLDDYCPALLPDVPVTNTLGDVLAANNIKQLRIAETEKYNHVTYFFDAERTIDYPAEKKILIESPNVATFDLKPEMAAIEITDALLPELENFDLVILNYANGDMVGHTGIESAAVKAMETLDAQLSRLVPKVLEMGGTILITADHGNAEKMWNEELDTPWTAHTTNPVPFIVVGAGDIQLRSGGGLADIAPTMLKLLDIEQPAEMTGKSIV